MTFKRHFPESFDVETRGNEPALEKCIMWPSVLEYVDQRQICGAKSFPNIRDIKIRFGKRFNVEPLTCFVESISEAQNRILIVDPYLFEDREGFSQIRVDQVLKWFSLRIDATDIRLLTGKIDEEVEASVLDQFASLTFETGRHLNKLVEVKIKFSLSTFFPYVHDRFAIIDDELWHFGATVGGLHHQVSAATRGWRADDYGAQEFFNLAWDGDKDFKWMKKSTK